MAAEAAPPADAALALFRPVRPGNAFEETVARLLQAIRQGVIPPGDSLPSERDLAARLGVSRDTVRDALAALSEAGRLERRRGRYGGAFVLPEARSASAPPGAPPAGEDLDDALGLRLVLETGAVRLAAARTLSAHDRELLHRRTTETAGAAGEDYRRLDSRLHLAWGELAGVPSLLPLLVDARARVNALLDAIPLLGPSIAHSTSQHAAITAAVLHGDADAAAGAVEEHLAGTASLLRAFLG